MRYPSATPGLAGNDLRQVRVFVGPDAMGNVTGVVTVGPDTRPEGLAAGARLLGYPETAFVRQDAGTVHVTSYSPYERLRVCTQTLLATEHVLRSRRELSPGTDLLAGTDVGEVPVRRYEDMAYVVLTGKRTPVRAARARLPLDGVVHGEAFVVDTGRARSYVRLSPDTLEAVRLDPAAVLSYCAAEGVRGICLVARSDNAVRLRVFTTSLAGTEDVATGGAAGGLPAFLAATGGGHSQSVLVRQGYGTALTRGELHVRPLGGAQVAVGGRVISLSTGRLDAGCLP
ncbi:PhzF family phenazine biosynthesis protein [Salinispora sp. H7-4]|uniref:PhzF family phenazine biosynthesis protein n=1 Tax=Salinispora sp. H7-4 TaxID=2748321 RepID=UPI0015D3CE06|nr:PhzF family phenazine biosynthesis protein [Salinispora sp. H7-4]NYT93684.1 PhzF family phenazine biosynthesis protein [Salinispora sp. H7-4]